MGRGSVLGEAGGGLQQRRDALDEHWASTGSSAISATGRNAHTQDSLGFPISYKCQR